MVCDSQNPGLQKLKIESSLGAILRAMKSITKLQRVENLALFVAATTVYFTNGLSWIWYLALLLVFDLFMSGYLVNSRVGAITYNMGHSYILPSLVLVAYCLYPNDYLLGLACLWFAHIGFDRTLGYGLKFGDAFTHTHLGVIGK